MSPSIGASLIFFFVVPLLTLFQRCGGAAASNTVYDLQYKHCSTDGGGDDLYRANVRQLLGALPSNAISNNGFYEGTSGSATDTVFGMAMCQADIPWPDQCQSCLQAASAQAPMACPSSSDADVAYRGCVLRYSGAQIPTDVRFDVNSSYAFHTVINAARVLDTDAFTEVRRVLFTDLASAAAASPLMMASGNRMFNATHNLYGLAQCNRDMRREQCSSIITGAIQSIQDYDFGEEMWSEGLSITGFSIYIRYDLTAFYVTPTAGSPHQETTQGTPHLAAGGGAPNPPPTTPQSSSASSPAAEFLILLPAACLLHFLVFGVTRPF